MVDYLSPAGLKRKIDDLLARTEQALGRLDGGRAQLNGGGSKHQKTAPAQKAGRPATPQVHGSSNVLEDVKRLVKKVASNRNSVIFCKVVDPVTDQVPDYLDVVCRPLDFGTIVKRIDADARAPPGTHHYPDVPTLYADFHQVCANATTYWAKQPDSFIYSTAEKLLKRFDADCAAAVQRSNDPGLESLKQDARGVVGALKAIAAEKQEEALHRERKAGTIPMSAKRMDELVDRLEPLLADDEVVSEVIAMVQEEKGTDEPPDDFDPADVSCQTQWRMWYRLRQWEVQVRDRGLGAASGASPAHPQDGAGVPANEQPDAETGGGAAEMMPQDLVPFGEREDKSSGARSPAETDNDGGGWAAVMDEDKENSAGGWADVLGDNATPLRVDEEVSRYTTRLARTEGERKEARDKLSRERAQRAQDERQKEADLERLVTESSREHWWGVERDYQNIAHTSEGELNGVLNEWEFTTGMRIDSIQLNAGLSLVEPSPAYTEATRPPPLSVVTCPSPAYGDQVTSSSYIALSPYFGGATPNAAKKLVSPAANPIVDPTLPPELSLAPTSPNLRDKP